METKTAYFSDYTTRDRGFSSFIEYGFVYQVLRIVVSLAAGFIAVKLTWDAEPRHVELFLVVAAITAIAYTILARVVNILIAIIFLYSVTLRIEIDDSFRFYDDNKLEMDIPLKNIIRLDCEPEYLEEKIDDKRIKRISKCGTFKLFYHNDEGAEKSYSFSYYFENKWAEIARELISRGVDCGEGRSYHESRWVYSEDIGSPRLPNEKGLYQPANKAYEIFENGDLTTPKHPNKIALNLHCFKEFLDISHRHENGLWSHELCAIDEYGNKTIYTWYGRSSYKHFIKIISKVTGKPVIDKTTSKYIERRGDDDDEYDEYIDILYPPEEKSAQKDAIGWEKSAVMLNASLEIDRIDNLYLDDETKAQLKGMEIGDALSKVHDLNKKDR